MPREAKRSKKVDTAIIVAVIGLVGTIIAALLSSPVLTKLVERTQMKWEVKVSHRKR